MITCREVSRLVSDSQERELPFRQRIAMRIHLFLCVFCRRFRDQLALLRDIMDQYQIAVMDDLMMTGETALSPDARRNVIKMLSKNPSGDD